MVTTLRGLRRAILVLAVSIFAVAGVARADDPPQPRAEAAAPAGQKGGRGSGPQGASQTSSSPAELHRLPPDSTTRQTLDLPGRTLSFAATAGS